MSRTEKKAREKRSFKQWIQGLKNWQRIAILAGTIVVLALLIGGIAVYSYFSGIVDEMHEPTPEDCDLSLVDVDGYINLSLIHI